MQAWSAVYTSEHTSTVTCPFGINLLKLTVINVAICRFGRLLILHYYTLLGLDGVHAIGQTNKPLPTHTTLNLR